MRADRMRVLTRDGVAVTLVVTDAAASVIGRHWNAARRYLYTGKTDRLDEFQDESINFHRLLTDPDRIDELALIGELDITTIYEDRDES
jgi:hypothetical protein